MKIGITERGDAGINLEWKDKLKDVDGSILITKNITDEFIDAVLSSDKPLIVHCTCTGWGHTAVEPNVPDYKYQLMQLKKLINKGFPADNCVLRIDPIFPSEKGIERFHSVMKKFISMDLKVKRIRVSIIDEYKHIKDRYLQRHWKPLYPGTAMYADKNQINLVSDALQEYPNYIFETCAEDDLARICINTEMCGCISKKDLNIMGLSIEGNETENPQNRKGCHCLSCKTELLSSRHPCKNGCIYCYWK